MFAKVIVDIDNAQVDKTFEYSVPGDMCVSIGQRVLIPFAGKQVEGIVLELEENNDYDIDKMSIKSIILLLRATVIFFHRSHRLRHRWSVLRHHR